MPTDFDPGGPGWGEPEWNLLYLNWGVLRFSPDLERWPELPDTPDARTCWPCRMMIGEIFRPEDAPILPAHPHCRCFYVPTREAATVNPDTFWDDWDKKNIWHWVLVAAYMLRRGDRVLPGLLEKLRDLAEEYNRRREERGEEGDMPEFEEHDHGGWDPSEGELLTPNALYSRGVLQLKGARPGRREYDCVFIRPGRVMREDGQRSDWLIPSGVLEGAAPMFNGVASYLDHPESFGFGGRQVPSVRDLVGVTDDVQWTGEGIAGRLRLYDENELGAGAFVGALMDQILADKAAGRPVPGVGLSAVFFHRAELDESSGLLVTREIAHVESVDFVYSPGAGGYVRAALARVPALGRYYRIGAVAPLTQEVSMPEERDPQEVGEVVGRSAETVSGTVAQAAAPTSDAAVNQMLAVFEERLNGLERSIRSFPGVSQETPPALTPLLEMTDLNEIADRLDHLTALLAGQEEPQTVQGHGQAPRTRISVGPGSLEQVELALQALLAGVNPPSGVRPLTGIRELYHLLSGDYEMTGVYQADRVYLANVTTSTMAGLCANALNKVVINEFMQYPQWWGPAVTIVDFPSLQDARWTTLGGVGELPTVAEGAAYTEMTWDDQTETDSFVKKGGYLGLTLEAIDKDDTNRLRAAPRALAQAAWLTLGNSISDIFTSNSGAGPTMADTGALFNATAVTTAGGHANLLTTALSLSQFRTVKIAMMKQPEVNSSTRLGALTRPRLLWVPVDLEDTAVQILATEHDTGSANWAANVDATGNERETRLANARARVIVCPLWTDTNNWAAQADPRLYPSIGLGFRYGRTPEIFSVADPRAGLMFSNDVMPIKVRFFYAVGPTDWRGLHKSNVA